VTHPDPSTATDASQTDKGRADTVLRMQTPITQLPGISLQRSRQLTALGLRRARDLMFLFPRYHEFPAPPTSVPNLKEGESASVVGKITETELAGRRPGKSVFGAVLENESGAIRLVFFNQPFRADQLSVGNRYRVEGQPKLSGLRWEFVHPKLTPIDEGDADQSSCIQPVYPLTEGVKQYELRRLTRHVTDQLVDGLTEVMPTRWRRQAAERLHAAGLFTGGVLPSIASAIRQMHQPESAETLGEAQMRLVFQELLVMQLALAMRRRKLTTDLNAPPLECTPLIRQRIVRRFPFELTADQQRVIDEIARDMARQFPMNRLLQGDVGSGKTVVAIFAMLLAVAGRHQATLMAPTEVLARQHYQTLVKLLGDSRVRIGFLSGSLAATQRREVLNDAATGELDLVIGTQALLYNVQFRSLALCVIDEQHKFGVGQRVRLRSGGVDPHYLVMSATPIPRSIAMTQFGDVDLSTLREKPSGRGTIHTYLADDKWKGRWWTFLRQQVAEGQQAYVVAPRVGELKKDPASHPPTASNADQSDEVLPPTDGEETTDVEDLRQEDVTSVTETFEQLTSGPLQGLRVALLHGRQPPFEKQSVMQAFAKGEIDVLVSTTVIEVGIDVPNATLMTILGGNRFGLAQLHQLRGRIARGKRAGHVCVFTDGDGSPRDDERLRVFESTSDGFEIAEADFRLRGPGDLLGHRQSGLPPLRIADIQRDARVLEVARELAQEWIDEDPGLAASDLADLKKQVLLRYGDRLEIADA